ncbi:phosphoribosyl-ATP pyrophosphatase [Candidatus Carsonella ruddii]|uniref:phosphoribosyl-ATP pyrophosphatase n=1 Tax=Carsonella ruddii TaxID=114186 RepID=UPI003D3D2013
MIKKIIKILIKKTIVNNSYSNFILFKDLDFLIKKIFEEIFELYNSFKNYIIVKNCYNRYFLIKEICDIIYHILLFIFFNKISFYEIEKELYRRTKTSGIKEKYSR